MTIQCSVKLKKLIHLHYNTLIISFFFKILYTFGLDLRLTGVPTLETPCCRFSVLPVREGTFDSVRDSFVSSSSLVLSNSQDFLATVLLLFRIPLVLGTVLSGTAASSTELPLRVDARLVRTCML